MKADSKQVLITEESLGYTINEWKLRQSFGYSRFLGYEDYDNLVKKMSQAIESGHSIRKKSYYKNLNEVEKEIRDKVELEYQDELRSSKAALRDINDKITIVREEEQKKSMEIQKSLNNTIAECTDTIKKWEKDYKELEKGKKELSKIEELEKDLQFWKDEYARERKKKWYDKLFS